MHKVAFLAKDKELESGGTTTFLNHMETHELVDVLIIPRYIISVSFLSFLRKVLLTYETIHLNQLWSIQVNIIMIFGSILKKKIIISPHGSLSNEAIMGKIGNVKLIVLRFQSIFLSKRLDFHAASLMESAQIRKYFSRSRIIVIGHFVDPPLSLQDSIIDLNREIKIVFIGRIVWIKRILLFIDVFRRYLDEVGSSRIRLSVVGPGSRNIVLSPKYTKYISIDGPIYSEQKWELLSKSSFVLLPSFSENFGYSVLEGLTLGKPYITSKNTPWAEYASDGSGYIIDLDNYAQCRELFSNLEVLSKREYSSKVRKCLNISYSFSREKIMNEWTRFYNVR